MRRFSPLHVLTFSRYSGTFCNGRGVAAEFNRERGSSSKRVASRLEVAVHGTAARAEHVSRSAHIPLRSGQRPANDGALGLSQGARLAVCQGIQQLKNLCVRFAYHCSEFFSSLWRRCPARCAIANESKACAGSRAAPAGAARPVAPRCGMVVSSVTVIAYDLARRRAEGGGFPSSLAWAYQPCLDLAQWPHRCCIRGNVVLDWWRIPRALAATNLTFRPWEEDLSVRGKGDLARFFVVAHAAVDRRRERRVP